MPRLATAPNRASVPRRRQGTLYLGNISFFETVATPGRTRASPIPASRNGQVGPPFRHQLGDQAALAAPALDHIGKVEGAHQPDQVVVFRRLINAPVLAAVGAPGAKLTVASSVIAAAFTVPLTVAVPAVVAEVNVAV